MSQELISNTIRHAQASAIMLEIHHQEDSIQIHYQDDGKGMNLLPNKVFEGQGLKNMKARIKAHSGTVSFDSQLGKGFQAWIFVPIFSNTEKWLHSK